MTAARRRRRRRLATAPRPNDRQRAARARAHLEHRRVLWDPPGERALGSGSWCHVPRGVTRAGVVVDFGATRREPFWVAWRHSASREWAIGSSVVDSDSSGRKRPRDQRREGLLSRTCATTSSSCPMCICSSRADGGRASSTAWAPARTTRGAAAAATARSSGACSLARVLRGAVPNGSYTRLRSGLREAVLMRDATSSSLGACSRGSPTGRSATTACASSTSRARSPTAARSSRSSTRPTRGEGGVV